MRPLHASLDRFDVERAFVVTDRLKRANSLIWERRVRVRFQNGPAALFALVQHGINLNLVRRDDEDDKAD